MKFTGSFWVKHKNTQVKEDSNEKNALYFQFSSVQSLSRVRLFVTPMNHSTPGFPDHQQLPEFTQTHVHWVGDAIQYFKSYKMMCSLILKFKYFVQNVICAACSVAHLCLTLCNPMDFDLQAPLSMGFYRQKYWSGLPALLGDLPSPGI